MESKQTKHKDIWEKMDEFYTNFEHIKLVEKLDKLFIENVNRKEPYTPLELLDKWDNIKSL